MPDMSDPLGAPTIVTGPQYMDALARLGYNVENMTSSLPLITKIAQAGSSLLDQVYAQHQDYQKAQADLAWSAERTRGLKDSNDLLAATFDNRVKASDLDLQQKQLATEYDKGTLDARIQSTQLLAEAQKQKNDFAAKTDPLHEQILEAQANTAKTQNDQYQKAVTAQNAATDKWQTEYQNFPQALNNPNYQAQVNDWMTKNGDLVFNPATSPEVAKLKQVQDGIYNAQASTQVSAAMRDELIQNQKEGLMPLVVNPDSLNQDQKQDWIVKSNLQRTYQKLQAAVNSLPEVGGTPAVQQLRQRLINFSDQVQAHMRDDSEINFIKSGQNPNVNPNGQERAEIARALQDTATYLQLTGAQKPAELGVEPPTKPGEGPRITAKGTQEQLRALGWLDEKGNYIGPGAKPIQAPGTQPLSPDEQTKRNAEADAVIAQAPGNTAVRQAAEAYRRGQLTISGFRDQISRFFQPKTTPEKKAAGGLVGYQQGGLVDDVANVANPMLLAAAENQAPAALPLTPVGMPSQWPSLPTIAPRPQQPQQPQQLQQTQQPQQPQPVSSTDTSTYQPSATPARTPAVTTGPVTVPSFTGSFTLENIAGPQPATIRYNNPGAQYPGESARKFGSTSYGVIGGGNKIAKFPTPEAGAAAQFDLLDRKYTGKTIGSAIGEYSGQTGGPEQVAAYASNVARSVGLSPEDRITPELLRSPQGVTFAKTMARMETGRDFPMTDDQWHQAQQMAFGQQRYQYGGLVAPGAPIVENPTASTQPFWYNLLTSGKLTQPTSPIPSSLPLDEPGLNPVMGIGPWQGTIPEQSKMAVPTERTPEATRTYNFPYRTLEPYPPAGTLNRKDMEGQVLQTSTDTVPARLTPGEFVMNREAVNRIGAGNLEAMNQGTSLSVPTQSRLPYSDRSTAITSLI